MTGSQPTCTRERILTLLRLRGPMTAQQLSRELSISASAVRQHATLLERERLIVSRRRKCGVGRPGHEFALTAASEDSFPKSYKQVALSVLEAADAVGGEALVGQIVRQRYDEVRRQYEEKLRALPPEQRLARIAETQDEHGYLAHVEAEDHRLRLVQHNCPLIEVSSRYPHFCECERKMYEELIGRPVRLEQCRSRGSDCCTFTVQVGA